MGLNKYPETFPDEDLCLKVIKLLIACKQGKNNEFSDKFKQLCDSFIKEKRTKRCKKILQELKDVIDGKQTKPRSRFLRALIPDVSSFQVLGVLIDEAQHSFADPDLFSKKDFERLYSYYWRCFEVVFSAIQKGFGKGSLKLNANTSMEGLVQIIKEAYDRPIESFRGYQASYYYLIKQSLPPNAYCKVATTNYFHFVETLDETPAYLNGRLDLFENVNTREVIDIKRNRKNRNTLKEKYVPFILGQSFVKPLICLEQAKAYLDFAKMAKSCRYLVVLGYGINSSDEHVNTILRPLRKNKGGILFVVKDEAEEHRVRKTLHRLRHSKKLRFVYFEDKENRKVVEEVFSFITEREKKRN